MSQNKIVRGVATSVRTEGEETIIRYHDTDVVRFSADSIRLDSGGWQTATTKLRMNQAANQFGLGYHVYAEKYAWYVRWQGMALQFFDGMILKRG